MNVDAFSTILTAITPICVAIIGVIQTMQVKNNKKYRKIREEKEQLQREIREAKELKEREDAEEEKAEREQQIALLQSKMDQVVSEMQLFKTEIDFQKIARELTNLRKVNEFNFKYMQGINEFVLIIGDTLTSSSILNEEAQTKLKNEIFTHQRNEFQLVNDLYKMYI